MPMRDLTMTTKITPRETRAYILAQVELGRSLMDVCRETGVPYNTAWHWRGGTGEDAMREQYRADVQARLDERDARERFAAQYHNPTAYCFGDPPAGRSALDQRKETP